MLQWCYITDVGDFTMQNLVINSVDSTHTVSNIRHQHRYSHNWRSRLWNNFIVITYCSVTCHQNSVTNIRNNWQLWITSITVGVSTGFWTGSNYLLTYFEHWSTRSRTNPRCNILDMFIEVNGPTRIIQFVTPGCRRRRFVGYFRPTEKSRKFHHIFQNQTFWTMTWFCDSKFMSDQRYFVQKRIFYVRLRIATRITEFSIYEFCLFTNYFLITVEDENLAPWSNWPTRRVIGMSHRFFWVRFWGW